jgi:UDPglucose--hexose-1-phosphate uridylyltransferase
MLPRIIMEQHHPDQNHWQTRIVPNKYPALTEEGKTERYRDGIYLAMPAYGLHEVIIESPLHNKNLAQMSLTEVELALETYRKRYVDVMAEHAHMMAILFRNHGARAETSLAHPHSQLVVTGIVPRRVRWREETAQQYFDDWGRCVLCDILRYESQERSRIIIQSDSFLSFVPYAAEVPFEAWIVPTRHQADFGMLTDQEKEDFAFNLREVLSRLHKKLDDPDYNYVFHSAAQYKADEPHLHWYLQIKPRLTTQAGFEIGSGMRINPSLSEDDAHFLQEDETNV